MKPASKPSNPPSTSRPEPQSLNTGREYTATGQGSQHRRFSLSSPTEQLANETTTDMPTNGNSPNYQPSNQGPA